LYSHQDNTDFSLTCSIGRNLAAAPSQHGYWPKGKQALRKGIAGNSGSAE
jgi:hypothetical protein